jgi:hypothetical protein
LTAALIIACPLLGVSAVAGAATYVSKIAATSPLTFCPGTAALCKGSEGTIVKGAAVHMICWQNPASDKTHRYFYIQASNGLEGFVHAGAVVQSTQTKTPSCSTVSWINAANWALSQDGQSKVPANAKYGNNVTYWSGWCWLFAFDAWRLGAGHAPRNGLTAQGTYNLYNALGRMHPPGSSPPRGSLVFFRYVDSHGESLGHVAISLGDGWVEETQGNYDPSHPPVTHKRISSVGHLEIGYVLPEKV